MTRSFGVSMDDDMADRIEESLEYGDDRSERIRALAGDGLVIEDALDDLGYEFDTDRDRRAFVRQALLDRGRRESDE